MKFGRRAKKDLMGGGNFLSAASPTQIKTLLYQFYHCTTSVNYSGTHLWKVAVTFSLKKKATRLSKNSFPEAWLLFRGSTVTWTGSKLNSRWGESFPIIAWKSPPCTKSTVLWIERVGHCVYPSCGGIIGFVVPNGTTSR